MTKDQLIEGKYYECQYNYRNYLLKYTGHINSCACINGYEGESWENYGEAYGFSVLTADDFTERLPDSSTQQLEACIKLGRFVSPVKEVCETYEIY